MNLPKPVRGAEQLHHSFDQRQSGIIEDARLFVHGKTAHDPSTTSAGWLLNRDPPVMLSGNKQPSREATQFAKITSF